MVYGYKNFDSFKKFYGHMKKNTTKQDNIIMHFRYATHGLHSNTASHPFPISNKIEDLEALQWINKIGVAHNGVMSEFLSFEDRNLNLSDTQAFIKNFLSKNYIKNNLFDKKITYKIENKILGNKISILNFNGDILLLGENWIKDKDIYYSNNGYNINSKIYDLSKYNYKDDYEYNDYNIYKYDKRTNKTLYFRCVNCGREYHIDLMSEETDVCFSCYYAYHDKIFSKKESRNIFKCLMCDDYYDNNEMSSEKDVCQSCYNVFKDDIFFNAHFNKKTKY